MRPVDSNIFLRYLTGDDPQKAAACLALFQRVQRGEEELTTNEVVLHEVLYILSSKAHYSLSHAEAAARLLPLIRLPGMKLPGKGRHLRALELYGSYSWLDFADALSIAYVEEQGSAEILSYDTDFDRIPGIKRVEP